VELRPLGATGVMVSAVGLGLVKLGRTAGLKHPGAFALPDERGAAELLEVAREVGINLLDTAPAYGVSEERLGGLLAAGVAGGREVWVISTKAGEEFDGERSWFDFSPAAITASIERSLVRLRTDRVDIAMLHLGPDDHGTLVRSGAMGALERLKRAGKVRAIGASTKTPGAAREAVAQGADVLMLAYNPRDTADGPVIDECGARGVGVIVKKALLSGHLGELGALAPEEVRAAGGDAVGACLRFVYRGERGAAVSSVVLGTISAAHLRDNARAAAEALRAAGKQ
jgi:aryl-alcohol dehydrogenase-like predicted oxidoreductase